MSELVASIVRKNGRCAGVRVEGQDGQEWFLTLFEMGGARALVNTGQAERFQVAAVAEWDAEASRIGVEIWRTARLYRERRAAGWSDEDLVEAQYRRRLDAAVRAATSTGRSSIMLRAQGDSACGDANGRP